MSSGLEHSGVVTNGKVMTFGSNKYAQLGRGIDGKGEFIDAVARDVDGSPSPIASISCGGWHSINLHTDGSVSSFGWGGSFLMGAGALGLGSKRTALRPTSIDLSGEKVVQVACGNQHSLFLTESGKLYATGHGAYGILGTGDTSDELLPVEISCLEATLLPGEKVVKISCGASFSAFITNLGNLYLWGRNDSGQLGLGEESQGDMHSAERYPRRIAFFETERTFIKDIACGENHLVALTQNGALYYWGDRTWLEPHLVSLPEANGGLKGIVKISAGTKCSFALTESGILYTWGFKNSGCLALDDLKGNLLTPTAIPPSFFGYEKIVDISASRQRCLAATSDDEYIVTSPEEAEIVKKMCGKDAGKRS
jgi:alpha-tubulin suppressor-like RCC1 family protein